MCTGSHGRPNARAHFVSFVCFVEFVDHFIRQHKNDPRITRKTRTNTKGVEVDMVFVVSSQQSSLKLKGEDLLEKNDIAMFAARAPGRAR